ncbi:MAG: dihydrolipoamide acetyltransferase family protein [Anaerolineae bacterium]
MAELINMPKLGFDMREGKLGEWVKKEGEAVGQGEIIAIVETDKASVEVPAFRSGVLHKILVPAGESVPIGTPIAVIGEAGEQVDLAALGVAPAAAPAKPVAVAEVEAKAAPAAPAVEAAPVVEGRLAASPVALRMAGELGIDLRKVKGSGPGGRIIKRDIEAYLAAQDQAARAAPAAAPAVTPPMAIPSYEPTAGGYRAVPLTGMRQTIGRRMVESKTTMPHFYVTVDVDMAAAMELRSQLNALLPEERKISVNDFVIKAAALALRQFPNLNATFAGDEIRIHDQVNIGIAVAREAGLVVTVVRECDTKPLAQIAAEARELVGRAREGRMKPDDMVGGTFTISNLGMFDVENFIAIIGPGQAAILAISSVKQVPVVKDGQLAVGTRMKATISADHRVTDGAEAARFMQAFKAALEQPLRLLL